MKTELDFLLDVISENHEQIKGYNVDRNINIVALISWIKEAKRRFEKQGIEKNSKDKLVEIDTSKDNSFTHKC